MGITGYVKAALCAAFFIPAVLFAQQEGVSTEVVVGQDGLPVVSVGPVSALQEWTFTFSGGTVEQASTENGAHVAGMTETATLTSTGIKRFIARGNRAWFTGSVTVTATHDDANFGEVPKSILFQRYMQHEIDGSGRIPEATPITPTGQTPYIFLIKGGQNTGSTGWEYNKLGKYSTEYQFVDRAQDGTWTLTFATDWNTPSNTWDSAAYQQLFSTKWKMNLRVMAVVAKLGITATGYSNCKNSIVDNTGNMQVLAGSNLAAVVTTNAWDVPWQNSTNGDFGIPPLIFQATNTTFDLPLSTAESPLFAYKSFAGPGDPVGGNWDDHNYGKTFKPILQELPSLTGISLSKFTPLTFCLAGVGNDVIKAHSTFTTEANVVPFNPSVGVVVVYPEQVELSYDPENIGSTKGAYGYLSSETPNITDEHKLQIPYFKQGATSKSGGFTFRSKFKIPAAFYNGMSGPTCKIFYHQLIAGFAYFQEYPKDTQTSVYWTDPTHNQTNFNFLNYRDGLFVYPKTFDSIKTHADLKCLDTNGDPADQNFIYMSDSPGLAVCNTTDPGHSDAGSITMFQQGSNLNAYVMLKVGNQLVPVMYARWGVNVKVERKKYVNGADPMLAIDHSPGSIKSNSATAPTSFPIKGKADFPVYPDIVPYFEGN